MIDSYNSGADGDDRNGKKHATAKYHDRAPAGAASRARLAVTAIGLTALLLWQSDPRAVWQAARGADWRFIVLACVLVVVDRVLMAYRWWTLLSPWMSGRSETARKR